MILQLHVKIGKDSSDSELLSFKDHWQPTKSNSTHISDDTANEDLYSHHICIVYNVDFIAALEALSLLFGFILK